MTTPLFIGFCTISAAVLALALYRVALVRFKADECLHLMDAEVPVIQKQVATAHRLEVVDAWGKSLTVVAILAGLATYAAWWMRA